MTMTDVERDVRQRPQLVGGVELGGLDAEAKAAQQQAPAATSSKPSRTSTEQSPPIVTSAQRRKNYKTQTERSKRLRNRSLEMVLDETSVEQEPKSR